MASSIALRRATAAATTTAAAAASTLLTRFLKSKPLSSILTPSTAATRSFATATKPPPTASDNNDGNTPVAVHGPPQKTEMENPFQLDGPTGVIEVDESKNGTLVRVTLPGVGPDGIKVWAEDNTVFFTGNGEIEHPGEQSGRRYGGSLQFRPELNRAGGVTAEMVNGVLRMVVPNAEGGEKKKKKKDG